MDVGSYGLIPGAEENDGICWAGAPRGEVNATVSQLPDAASWPLGQDGNPLFACLPEFVVVYLVFATDVLARMGELEEAAYEHYLAELRRM